MKRIERIWSAFTRTFAGPITVVATGVALTWWSASFGQTPETSDFELYGWYAVAFFGGLALLIVGLIGAVEAANRRLYAGEKGPERLDKISSTLDSAKAAISAVSREIASRSRELEALKEEIASMETVSELSPEQIEHVLIAARKTSSPLRDWVLVGVGAISGAVLGAIIQVTILD